ncbi:MAG TPA: glycosyltransferase family 39 protein [Acidimicrobiales bacterium]|nr:glycosyltransferase family 39 protein [Acidimicrobiales bacterium]
MSTLAPLPGRVAQPAAASDRPPRVAATAGAALGVLTFVAYLPGLGRSLDFDSAQTVGMFVEPGPPWAAFTRQAVFNNHPMFSFFEQLVRVVTGSTAAATMRLLPILCGAVAVGVLTWFAARRHGLLAGLVAGTLVAANPTFATLSRSVRGYSLLTLCAVVSTVLVVRDDGRPSRRRDVAYIAVAGAGLATHLYMAPVLAAHAGFVLAGRGLDRRWRLRFLGTLTVAALAYVGMAGPMVDGMRSHGTVFQPRLPLQFTEMVTGGRWGTVVVLPLVVAGAVLMLRRRPARGAALALVAVLGVLWAVLQSSALTERFFVWLVPGAAYLAAVAVARIPVTALAVAPWTAVVVVTSLLPRYTDDPTAYRVAARVIRVANAEGARSCVVAVGVPPMLAYLDPPGDFARVDEPSQLDRCDVVVVAAWWATRDPWFEPDNRVIAAAERTFPHRTVLRHGDPTLVLSNRPLPAA